MRLLLKSLGPGVITGAADDDPSGIATYSVAGAQLGTKLLWTALLDVASNGRGSNDVCSNRDQQALTQVFLDARSISFVRLLTSSPWSGSAVYTTNIATPAANIAAVVIATTVHPQA
jgi:hypothetical protein